MNEFFYNIYNLSNHEHEIAINPHGGTIYFYLDGKWKIHNAENGVIFHTVEAAIDMCAWLNNGDWQPTGERVAA